MKAEDAPRPGWYPDPAGGSRLRWWDGLDWTDHRRAPPYADYSPEAVQSRSHEPVPHPDTSPLKSHERVGATRTRDETAEIMAEVRKTARDEVDRALSSLSDRARDVTRGIEPLISQYGDRVLGWIRNLGLVVIALVVLWVVLQTFAQTSLLNWLGDRVDNVFGGWVAVVAGQRGG